MRRASSLPVMMRGRMPVWLSMAASRVAAVLGFPRGAGRGGEDLVHLVRARQALELRQRLQRGAHGLAGQASSVEPAGAQSHHLLLAVDDFEREIRAHADHDHVDRVGADVDRGKAHGGVAAIMGAFRLPAELPTAHSMARRSPIDLLLSTRVAALAAAVPAALGGEPAAVHQARVASRRLREVVPILDDARLGRPGRRGRAARDSRARSGPGARCHQRRSTPTATASDAGASAGACRRRPRAVARPGRGHAGGPTALSTAQRRSSWPPSTRSRPRLDGLPVAAVAAAVRGARSAQRRPPRGAAALDRPGRAVCARAAPCRAHRREAAPLRARDRRRPAPRPHGHVLATVAGGAGDARPGARPARARRAPAPGRRRDRDPVATGLARSPAAGRVDRRRVPPAPRHVPRPAGGLAARWPRRCRRRPSRRTRRTAA